MTDFANRSPRDSTDSVRRLNPAAFAAEFESAAGALWTIAVGVLGSRDLAEDVLQEAAMIALTKLDQFDADTSFLAWMGAFVRHVALNAGRRRKRGPLSGVETDALPARTPVGLPRVTGHGELAAGDQELFDDRLLAALDKLDPTARACLLLRALHDLPYRQIALALDIPEGTAMSHVHRARSFVRQRLFDSHPAPTETRHS